MTENELNHMILGAGTGFMFGALLLWIFPALFLFLVVSGFTLAAIGNIKIDRWRGDL